MKGKDGTSQYSASKYNTSNKIWCIAMKYNASQYNTVHRNAMQCIALKGIIPEIYLFLISNDLNYTIVCSYMRCHIANCC